jgi:hypothetical protein
MNCRECDRLAAKLNRCQEVYYEALGRARSEAEAVNPNHYFRLKRAVQEAKLGLDSAVQDFRQHQEVHVFATIAAEHSGPTAFTTTKTLTMYPVTAVIKTANL